MSRLAKQEKNTRKKKKEGGGECACLFVRTKLSYSWGSKSIPLRFLRLRLLRVPPSIVPDSFAIVAPPPIPQTNPHTRYTLLQQKVFQTLTLIPELLLLPPTEIRFTPPLIVVCLLEFFPTLLQEVEKPIPACCWELQPVSGF
jgi:hypothetical protein